MISSIHPPVRVTTTVDLKIDEVAQQYSARFDRLGKNFPRSLECGGPRVESAYAIGVYGTDGQRGKISVSVDATLSRHSDLSEAEAIEQVKQIVKPVLEDARKITRRSYDVELSISLTRTGVHHVADAFG